MAELPPSHATRPLIGITPDVEDGRYRLSTAYAEMVERAGGLPVVLPALAARAADYVARCDGLILSGGDDPDMVQWGVPMHPKAKAIDPERQAFETALLALLDDDDRPALGVCLGMQLMALHAGGELDQHLPDTLPTAADHWGRTAHVVEGRIGRGTVHSHHRQAIVDPGGMTVVGRAPDGVIEAVRDERRPFRLGVQWHPERTDDAALGFALIAELVDAAKAKRGI